MTKVSSTNEYAVYEIDLGRSDGKMQETKRAGKDRLFDKILNIFGDKQNNDFNSIRLVFKMMFITSSFLIGWGLDRVSIHVKSFEENLSNWITVMMIVFMNHPIFMKLWKDTWYHTVMRWQMKNLKSKLTVSICKQSMELQSVMLNCILKAEHKIWNKDFTFVYSL